MEEVNIQSFLFQKPIVLLEDHFQHNSKLWVAGYGGYDDYNGYNDGYGFGSDRFGRGKNS